MRQLGVSSSEVKRRIGPPQLVAALFRVGLDCQAFANVHLFGYFQATGFDLAFGNQL
jgi:hypothetical protein